jgi:ribosomal protein S18 acetylase RimI-like enzyme
MRVRQYVPEYDHASLRACVVELQEYERSLEPQLPDGDSMADAYLADLQARCIRAKGVILVADIDRENVVGFVAVLTAVQQEELDEPPGSYAYVSDLVVRAAYRRRGIGEALMRQALAYAQDAGAKTIRIQVLSKNADAKRLYERLGFSEYRVELITRL